MENKQTIAGALPWLAVGACVWLVQTGIMRALGELDAIRAQLATHERQLTRVETVIATCQAAHAGAVVQAAR